MSPVTESRLRAGLLWSLVRAGFAEQAHYRLAVAAGLFTNVVFGFIRAAVLFAALDASTTAFAGYDRATLGGYVWISQALLGAVTLMVPVSPVEERIKNGDIAVDYLRPVPLVAAFALPAVGRAAYSLLPRGVPAVVVGLLTTGWFLPATPGPYLLGALSVAVAVVASYLGVHCIGLLGFWVVDTRGIKAFYGILGTFLAGLFVPVDLFPEWLRTLAAFTPFPTFLQYPVDVLSGRVLGAAAWQHLGVQLAWGLGLLALALLLERLGRRHLEVQGG
ncbi:ABC transporter permease [Desertihabitans aurantiacus]|uniref:ABC transporter permease n=1 Tax=Desertihabitans aurantiacus TaxID=2282477 RepID=UPI001E549195|nr:ABC-2 family transporter protein [Desertihabitans aurantiacus]